jgi:Protein of unknown function (DUF1003)
MDARRAAGDDRAMMTQARPDRGLPGRQPRLTGPLHRWVLAINPPRPVKPALIRHAEQRAAYTQNRVADAITTFAGSMAFVYLHVLWFGCWIALGVERYPFDLLTMIVSLEAIFLSTFIMISQNRADARRQTIADQQWKTVQGRTSKAASCSRCPSDPDADPGGPGLCRAPGSPHRITSTPRRARAALPAIV